MHDYAPMLTILKNLGGALRPSHTPYPRRLRHLCQLCPTHFLVPSGAYVYDMAHRT